MWLPAGYSYEYNTSAAYTGLYGYSYLCSLLTIPGNRLHNACIVSCTDDAKFMKAADVKGR